MNPRTHISILKKTTLVVSTCLLALIPMVHTGCVAVAAVGAGAGAVAYLRGSLQSHLSGSFDEAVEAVRFGIPTIGYVKIKEVSNQSEAKFTFRDSLDNKITISLNERQATLIEITIRVGHVGDENRSIQILNAINRELKDIR